MSINKLYNGKIELNFDDNRHIFTVNGKNIISVTACTGVINKPALIFWAANKGRDFLLENIETLIKSNSPDEIRELIIKASKEHTIIKEKAADTGTKIHEWVNGFIKSQLGKSEQMSLPEKESEVYNGVIAFLKWVDEHKIKFVSTEKKVYSRKYNYAGIMDCEAIIDKKDCVIDFKSSSGIYNEMRYQVAAYRYAAEEEIGRKHKGNNWIVKFGKNDGEFKAVELDNYPKDFKTFLACLTIKQRERELKNGNTTIKN